MKGWEEDIFNNSIKLNRGFDLPEKDIIEGTYPVVASTSIKAYHKYYKVNPPAVVTGRSGSLGTVQYINKKCWPLNTSLYVKDFKGNYPKYVFYFLKTFHLENFNSGAGVPTLNQNHLHKLKIRIPDFPIQRKIAAVLSAYDDLIENNNRRIALLEKMAEELYREWFVRLRFPGHEKVKIVKGVPEGWEVKQLREIAELAYGKALKEENRIEGNFPVIGSSGIIGYHNAALVKGPGIVVGRKGNVGKVIWSKKDFFPIDTVYFVRSEMPFEYLFYLIQSMNFINNDAAVPGLNREQAYSNKFYFPEKSLVELFTVTVKPLFLKRDMHVKQNDLITTSRDRLLSRLMSGKIDVENLDIRFPASMKEKEVTAHAELHL